ncbi:hypothetical protein [Vulgatibacter incomptus]|uniref:hypothetical protein n=1 Tax=Vulgatibacter incomptus TaxID=1391653 RepID=UPI0012F7097A|nr:hypothetical protein [Vulgatibacter incomptus]
MKKTIIAMVLGAVLAGCNGAGNKAELERRISELSSKVANVEVHENSTQATCRASATIVSHDGGYGPNGYKMDGTTSVKAAEIARMLDLKCTTEGLLDEVRRKRIEQGLPDTPITVDSPPLGIRRY